MQAPIAIGRWREEGGNSVDHSKVTWCELIHKAYFAQLNLLLRLLARFGPNFNHGHRITKFAQLSGFCDIDSIFGQIPNLLDRNYVLRSPLITLLAVWYGWWMMNCSKKVLFIKFINFEICEAV